jgi:UDP-N-acetylenolpyruvoylglucosamine reductase
MSFQLNFQTKNIYSWNETYKKKANILYPNNINELRKIFLELKKKKITYIIRTGECSYDNKSIIPDIKTFVISLKKLNKIVSVNKKNGFVIVEAGALIPKVVNQLRSKNSSLYSIPGGSHVSIGGAISANVIGKDSSKNIACFGDAIESLDILDENGSIKTIKKDSTKFNGYIGSFGLSGIILRAKIKIKKIKSENLKFTTRLLYNIGDVKKELENQTDYKYIQLDPFFRKENFGIVFNAKHINDNKNLYKIVNLDSYFYDKFFFKFSSFFINFLSWRIFYKVFFLFSKNKSDIINIYNFHYPSKYKHLIPHICKDGLSDYEFLIKKDFSKTLNNIISFLKKNNMYAIYIVIKKIHRSKKKYFYQYSDNGYSVAMAFDRNNAKKKIFKLLEKKFATLNLKLNLSKSDYHVIKEYKKENNLFMSLFKKKILDKDGPYI